MLGNSSASGGGTSERASVTISSTVSPDLATAPTPQVAYVRTSARSSSDSRGGISCIDDVDARVKLGLATRDRARLFLRHHGLLVGYSLLGVALLVMLTYLSFFAATMDDGGGGAEATPEFVGCRSWAYGDGCGLWGIDCRPFETNWSAFRCPTKCNLDGDTSLVVYGSGPYRADSRICRAAMHAGVIGSNGGCGYYKYSGAANAFYGSSAHGVSSQEFLSWFPKTIEFKAGASSNCTDLSWGIMAVGVVMFFGYALLPHTNPAALFYGLVAWGFMYVRVVGQPPSVDYKDIALRSFAEVFVLLAASHFVFHVGPVHTFSEWRQLSTRRRVVLWGLCYVVPFNTLLHMNYFAYVPWLNIDLGGYQESETSAGSYIVLAVGAVFVLYCAWVFLRQLWRLGAWKKYLAAYIALVAWVVITWGLFSSSYFHLHHTMLGAVLIPFTRFPTPLAAFAQSAALGAFVQGYAAWGWTAYLTVMSTFYAMDRHKVPPVVRNVTADSASVTWEPLRDVDGYSLRMNKVEVYRGLGTTAVVSQLQPNMTYFVTVAGVASWGTNGQTGPTANFTTLAIGS
ncbi:hypothetical protein PybrP1_011445 [[Pythium] brassicae (nom. inval.)]|nr:hypothetical protein PybrP1_011445 [[Pythium] brassicae (nom. inval.)]